MAYVNVTPQFGNQDKRLAEAVVMTCPAMIKEGSARTGQGPEYIASGDAWTASTVEADTIVKKAYLIIDEAFPTDTKLSVDIAGIAYFTDIDGAAEGVVISTEEDTYLKLGQTITVGIVKGPAGTQVESGVCRVVLDKVSVSLRNGYYAN